MPARAAWKGYLKLSQLSVPVKAFTATRSDEEISLNQLHRDCGQKIRWLKLCPIHGEVGTDQIISGYKLDEHSYLPIENSDLEGLRPEDDKSIHVEAFVAHDAIDPVHHAGRTYYLVPDSPPGQRPFCVLRDGMRSVGRFAFARVVIARREHLVLLRPLGRLVAMTVLEYSQRVCPAADFESEVGGLQSSPAELRLMESLIESLFHSDLNLADYRDRYIDGLDALITGRAAEKGATVDPAAGDSSDELVAALRASLAAAGIDPAQSTKDLLRSVIRRETNPENSQERKIG